MIVQGRGEPRIDTSSPGDRSVDPFVPPRVGSGPHTAEVEAWVPSHVSTRRMVIQFFCWRQGHFADSVKDRVCSMWNRGFREDMSVGAQRNNMGGCNETPPPNPLPVDGGFLLPSLRLRGDRGGLMVLSRCGDAFASGGWFDPTPALPADGGFLLPSLRLRGDRGGLMVLSRCGDAFASGGWFDPTPALPADGEGGRAGLLPPPRRGGAGGGVGFSSSLRFPLPIFGAVAMTVARNRLVRGS